MRLLLSLGLAFMVLAAGCSKDKDVEPPAVLLKYPGTLPVKKLWGDNVGGGKKQIVLRLGLGPAVDGATVFAASHKGEVVAVTAETGKQVWLKKLKLPLSAGPGVGQGLVVVGSTKGAVIALEAADGKERWRAKLNSELLSAPAVGEKVVVIRSVDGRLHGLDTGTGKEMWQVEQQVPRLSLRGTATPIIAKELAISGFDNGKVMAVSLATGDTVWDTALASPHGRTELDRLIDIDSAVRVEGDNVYAAGFQGRTAMLALDSGQIWWAHDMSSYRGLSVDPENLYVSQADGTVVAMHGRDGSEIWRNENLKRRGLSVPVITSTAIALADYQGYLHFLDKNTGVLVARVRVGKERVSNPPVVVNDAVIVLTDGGHLAAFRAAPIDPANPPKPAEPAPVKKSKADKKAEKKAAKEQAAKDKAAAKAAPTPPPPPVPVPAPSPVPPPSDGAPSLPQ